ncbi:amino acid permease [Myxococcus llanfairpwllgwyngyllgogerychwyrndrobwllllantysiliogogogochensis]|uniref:Amino acid permease n=1 Tax=Myxococcus llanfairpwllgwyngyllgogerychwyrndrobwllllantysiliogogogochensis TaxID=2590453 RepID=A0A540X2U1_9BACT|nr:amino acid permease [Myxococcus llanfairpwllgwyngyllgogerychwyrndrobwllllantysiliogogogochensis]TQF15582.1 amino acid permease [Myxococcus llanfairpwllgwyngyllgogerychwyrndrobwllllantysiliogogogochensis]
MSPPLEHEAGVPSGTSGGGYSRRVGLFSGVMLVIGGIIGSGIFLNPSIVAQRVHTPALTLGAWLLGGGVALIGAFIYGELGQRIPKAGGSYVYLRDAFGELPAFLNAWGMLLMIATGAIAAVAVTFANYTLALTGLADGYRFPLAVGAIVLLSGINYFGVRPGALTQNVFTVLKLVALAVLVGAGLLLAGASPSVGTTTPPAPPDSIVLALGAALVPVLFSYGGWQQTNFVAEELVNPERNLPRALLWGVIGVVTVYLLANLTYLRTLGAEGLAASNAPAADALGLLLGPTGRTFITAGVALSTFGFLNLVILVSPRVYQAMAADGLFFPWMARLHPRYHTPSAAIVFQAVWAILLTSTGTYGELLDYVVFADWLVFGATAATLFVYRARERQGQVPRVTYRVPGHPFTPLLFIAAALYVVVGSTASNPLNALKGTLLLGAGVPVFLYWRKRREARATAQVSGTDVVEGPSVPEQPVRSAVSGKRGAD